MPDTPNAAPVTREDRRVYWIGAEDQQQVERMKACRARCAQYGDDDCDKDGSCAECEFDMTEALRVTKAEYEAAGGDYE